MEAIKNKKEVLMKRIYRDTEHKMLAGICAGVGEMVNIDPTLIRLALVFITIVTAVFPLIAVYIVGWVIIPEKGDLESGAGKK
jgi:phage shock protein C